MAQPLSRGFQAKALLLGHTVSFSLVDPRQVLLLGHALLAFIISTKATSICSGFLAQEWVVLSVLSLWHSI